MDKRRELRVARVVREQGRRHMWLAERLGVTPGHVTRLLNGERRWTEELRPKAAQALGWGGDEAKLFEVVDGRQQ